MGDLGFKNKHRMLSEKVGIVIYNVTANNEFNF